MDRTQNTCRTYCSSRFFENTVNNTCDACPYDCYSCDGSGNCLSCSSYDRKTMKNTSQRCVPRSGYYESGRKRVKVVRVSLVSITDKVNVKEVISFQETNAINSFTRFYLNLSEPRETHESVSAPREETYSGTGQLHL